MANIGTVARRYPKLSERFYWRCADDDLANLEPAWQLLWRRGLQTDWRNQLVALRNVWPLLERYVEERNVEHQDYVSSCACVRCHNSALAFAEKPEQKSWSRRSSRRC